jgi:hypothetical protein
MLFIPHSFINWIKATAPGRNVRRCNPGASFEVDLFLQNNPFYLNYEAFAGSGKKAGYEIFMVFAGLGFTSSFLGKVI